MRETLEQLVAGELAAPVPDALDALTREILRRHGSGIAAILFYGSCRRTGDVSGLLDLYVLHDGHRAFHRRTMAALLNRLLPPNILFLTVPYGEGMIRAKVAILSCRQFGRRMRLESMDTTLWARFSQPATLLHSRDEAVRHWLEAALAEGIRTAVRWGTGLGPPDRTSAEVWHTLFAHTYAAELRPERNDRPALVYDTNPVWFDRAIALGDDPALDEAGRRRLRTAWAMRRIWGKALNILRLAKASFTVENGTDYLVWKIERHSGVPLVLSQWQRRHPLLAAPALLWRLRRSGAIR